MFKNKSILITGGTGSFGKEFVTELLNKHQPRSIRIFSRDELKQWEMRKKLEPHRKSGLLRFFIGDVRDQTRLDLALNDVDIVVHAAALKQVPACEYNPIEAINTNVTGAINVIGASLKNNVSQVIALSTDKASEPINLYGATKLCSDKLFVQSNSYAGKRKTRFSVVRYGNVMGSRGSVIPLFYEQKNSGIITITDGDMTRFWITLPEAVEFVIDSLKLMQGGELFVPKIPSMKIIDLATVIAPDAKIKIVGKRPGEKLHESLISANEASQTYDLESCYLIKPTMLERWSNHPKKYKLNKKVKDQFSYTSDKNSDFLTIPAMKKKLVKLGFQTK